MPTPNLYWHQRPVTQSTMAAPGFDLSTMLFPQSVFSYSSTYDPLNLAYDFGLGSAGNNITCSANVSPQQVFGQDFACAEQSDPVASDLDNEGNPSIKTEPSPLESPAADSYCGRAEGHQQLPIAVGTDVDSLMKTIQEKAPKPLQPMQVARKNLSSSQSSSNDFGLSTAESNNQSGPAPRRTYPCKTQSCAKVFTQKTHLEIHMRAHTGHKPYV